MSESLSASSGRRSWCCAALRLVGSPHSPKDTFGPLRSSLRIGPRALICDDERDQRFNTQAFALLHFLVEQRLTLNRLCVVDSTALTAQSRKDLLALAKKCQVPTTLILFNVPLDTCIERDGKRERSVGKAIVERQYHALEQARETIRQEGFDQVVELQDGDLEKVQIEILFRPVQRPQRPDEVAPRRFERPAPTSGRRPNAPRNTVHSASTPPASQPAASPWPATISASLSTPKEATPRSAVAPAPVTRTQSAPAVHTSVPRPISLAEFAQPCGCTLQTRVGCKLSLVSVGGKTLGGN